MIKFITASDSFKESLSAKAACQAMTDGIKRVFPEAEVIQVPMADGGEGTVDAILSCIPGKVERWLPVPMAEGSWPAMV